MRRQETANRFRARFAGAAVIALALVGGCGTADQEPAGGGASPTGGVSPESTRQEMSPTASAQEGLDILEARDAVLQEFPGAVIHDLDLEKDSQEWFVEFSREGYERGAVVNAVSGDVTQDQNLPNDDDDRPSWDLSALPENSLDTAVAAALEEVQGHQVSDASLDEDDGRLIWEIEVDNPDPASAGKEIKVDVDAETGEVLRTES